ncbi:MAG TPA: DUF2071 domain-containing protein [Chitinophagaceae bacterium]|nr:DUF2071 domain-containing protein [Chitinophagaceae bacterium]
MSHQSIFLNAEWRKLIMANYQVDPAILEPYVPAGTTLDFWRDRCYISLVGFLFRKVRVKEFAIPFHTRFPEINLRFYVKQEINGVNRRGVVFISEIVPKPAISFVANQLYQEKYRTFPMQYDWKIHTNKQEVVYQCKNKGRWNSLEVMADKDASALKPGSEEAFITEHYWGFAAGKRGTTAYQVMHPQWDIAAVQSSSISKDFFGIYDPTFRFLDSEKPASVFLAEGSAIQVYSGQRFEY